jgi:flagellin
LFNNSFEDRISYPGAESQSTVNNLQISEENLSAANSRIRDTDVAYAAAELARNNVLLQTGTATLAQANNTTGLALKLLG